ncbi:MAG: amino acid permease [Bacteroidota bacterium]
MLLRRKPVDQILKESEIQSEGGNRLRKSLGLTDLTALAIAAIIGAGIFSTIGNASFDGGPAVSLMFVFTALACAFSALCYAEFASRIPISGSAYTYAYASLGEIIAWIIGWDLIMEYSVGNVAVAISWSEYFTGLMHGLGVHIPEFLASNYASAADGFKQATQLMKDGSVFADLPVQMRDGYMAWTTAPQIMGFRIIADIPAFAIVVLISSIVYRGIRESKTAGNIFVLIKLSVILAVIAIGSFYVNTDNWSPFAPNGLGGVLKGVSAVFFAYIGFDAISTTAEECKNPRRDLPRAMILSLIICTVLYVAITLILTGMVHYKNLNVGDPLAFVFAEVGLDWISGIVAMSALVAMAGVLLVFQVGQPRIWMSMSRDGLLPKRFSSIHPKFKTPAFSTVITCILVSIPSLFLSLDFVTDMTSIGTLFAFILVCMGVLMMKDAPGEKPKFKIKYVNSRFILPVLYAAAISAVVIANRNGVVDFFDFTTVNADETYWEMIGSKIPILSFLLFSLIFLYLSIKKKYSLVPVLGLLINGYLVTELGVINWIRFLIWMAIGLVVYFLFGMKNSKLATRFMNKQKTKDK